MDIKLNTNIKVIEISLIGDKTLFDWCKVIENATEIHTVDTSINYVIETLNLKAVELNIYPRHSDHIKKCLGPIFKKPYKWVC